MSVSKADVCTLYVDGVTKPWKQDPLELKDGTPIQGGTQLPFSSTKEGRQELKTFLNDLSPLWQWNYRGGSSYFPGTRVIRHDYLRCHFAGEVRKKGGKFAVRTKRCGCEAGFNIVWTTAGALHCVVNLVSWWHVGHHPPNEYELTEKGLVFSDLTEPQQQSIISAYVDLPQNPVQTDASEIARRLVGDVYVTTRAVKHMLVLAKAIRDRRDSDLDRIKLASQKQFRSLILTPESIEFRDPTKSQSENLICALKKLYLDYPGFRFIVEFGMPTLEHLLGYHFPTCLHLLGYHFPTCLHFPTFHPSLSTRRPCAFDEPVALILSNLAQNFFQGTGAHTYITEAVCCLQPEAAPSVSTSPPAQTLSHDDSLFDLRVIFDEASFAYKLAACGTVLPHSTLLAALATPVASKAMFVKQNTVWNRKSLQRHEGWRLIGDGLPLKEGMRKALVGDAAFQNICTFIRQSIALTGKDAISLLPGSPRMLCKVAAHNVGTQADRIFRHVESGETALWEYHPTSKPSKMSIVAVTVSPPPPLPSPPLSPLLHFTGLDICGLHWHSA